MFFLIFEKKRMLETAVKWQVSVQYLCHRSQRGAGFGLFIENLRFFRLDDRPLLVEKQQKNRQSSSAWIKVVPRHSSLRANVQVRAEKVIRHDHIHRSRKNGGLSGLVFRGHFTEHVSKARKHVVEELDQGALGHGIVQVAIDAVVDTVQHDGVTGGEEFASDEVGDFRLGHGECHVEIASGGDFFGQLQERDNVAEGGGTSEEYVLFSGVGHDDWRLVEPKTWWKKIRM